MVQIEIWSSVKIAVVHDLKEMYQPSRLVDTKAAVAQIASNCPQIMVVSNYAAKTMVFK